MTFNMKINIRTKLLLILCVTIMFGSCTKEAHTKNNSDSLITQDSICKSHASMNILKDKIISEGDTLAYLQLKLMRNNDEFILYSMIMADNYHYPPAYYDVYLSLIRIYNGNFKIMDSQTKSLAISHLKKGAELKQAQCISELLKPDLH